MKRLLFAFVFFVAASAGARVLLTQEQALATAFPAAVKVTRQKFFLTPEQLAAARSRALVNATRKVLALHHVLTGVTPR